jgi:dihydrolipoamide dehydrogenase
MMDRKRVVVIGGGPGGYVAAIRAAQLGAKVTLIEKDKIGGTCLNRGCIPTKSLLFDVKLLRSLRHSSVFQSLSQDGFNPFASMMARKEKVVEELVKGVILILESHRVSIKYGHADLLGPHQVIFSDGEGKKETMEADAIILAPGSTSKALPGLIPDGEKILTSDEALRLKKLPREVIIIGGGYIGIEFATLFHTLESKVTVVEILENILPGLEGELVRNLRRFLERDGVRVLTKSKIDKMQTTEDGLRLTVGTPQGIETLTAERILLAVGRGPNLDLDLSKAGVDVSPAGIRVDRRMKTSAPHIYAVGDATGGTMLAHVAMEEGVVAAENGMGDDRKMVKDPVPLCIFTYPEVASIGLTEKEAKEKGAIKIGRFPFRSNPTALISDETDGLVKIIGSRETDEILGVHIIGPNASTLISIASVMMRKGMKGKDFSGIIQAHPTLPEALKEGVLDMDGMAIHLPKPLRPKA